MITQIKNFLKKKPTYSRPSARVIMASLLLLLVLYLFKDVINMSTSTSFIIASIIINIITLNIVTIHPQKNNWQAILQDFAFVTIFLTISFLIFSIFVLHGANLIDTESKATFTSIGSGLIAIFGFIFIYQRLEKQQKQIDIQIDQLTIQINHRIDDRFNSAINLLGSSETSARTGAIYALHELAIEEEKYRRKIAQILCSHIRSKTDEAEYKKTHSKRPSNEIQTTIDLLFKEEGLYAQGFKGVAKPSKANLSHAYLMGADFRDAQCQGVDFKYAQCQKANFRDAQCREANFRGARCQGANFFGAQCREAGFLGAQCRKASFSDARCQEADFRNARCQGASFLGARCQKADFMGAECQKANFRNAQCREANFVGAECQGADFTATGCQKADFGDARCQGADFTNSQCQEANFVGAECQGADFAGAQSDMPLAIQIEGEISDEAIKAIEDAQPYLDNSWYEKMQKIIKENKGKNSKHENIQTLAS